VGMRKGGDRRKTFGYDFNHKRWVKVPGVAYKVLLGKAIGVGKETCTIIIRKNRGLI